MFIVQEKISGLRQKLNNVISALVCEFLATVCRVAMYVKGTAANMTFIAVLLS